MKQGGENSAHITRRAFLENALRHLRGASAFVIAMAHTNPLDALEFGARTSWAEGLRALREATAEPNEHVAFFVGDKVSGKWKHKIEGGPFAIDGSHAQLGKEMARNSERNELTKGVAMYHTHVTLSVDRRYADFVAQMEARGTLPDGYAQRAEAVKEIYSAPSPVDISTVSEGFLEKYLALAEVKHAPIEFGIVSKKMTWSTKRIVWDAGTKNRYAREYAFFQERELALSHTKKLVRDYIASHTDARVILERFALSSEWRAVVNSDPVKLDLLTDMLVSLGFQMPESVVRYILSSMYNAGLGDLLLDHWSHYAPVPVLQAEMNSILAGIHEGRMSAKAARERLQKGWREFGVEVTETSH